jgi:hypothetical protein
MSEAILPLVKDLNYHCFRCINFVFELRPSTQIVFLFENCSSLLSELLPEIAGTFWLDKVVPDWRTKTEITDKIMQDHVQDLMNSKKKMHQFEDLVRKSEKMVNDSESQHKSFKDHEFYKCLKKLRALHVFIHEDMTKILTAMKRIKPVIRQLRVREETGRRPRTKNVEMLLDRLMQI